jgi:hypothetical protein
LVVGAAARAGKELARCSFYLTAKGSSQEEDDFITILYLEKGVEGVFEEKSLERDAIRKMAR